MTLRLDGPTLRKGRWKFQWAATFAPKLQYPKVPHLVGFFRRVADSSGARNLSMQPRADEVLKAHVPITKLPILPLGTVLEVSPENVHGDTGFGPSTIMGLQPSHDTHSEKLLCFDASNLEIVSRVTGLQSLPGYKNSKLHLDLLPPELATDTDYDGYFVRFKRENVLIPCYEIFRAFYARDSKFVQWYFNDRFDQPSRFLYNPVRCAFDKQSGAAMVWLRQWVEDRHARFIAHFAFSEGAMSAARTIKSHYMFDGKDKRSRLVARPHFDGNWRIKYRQVRTANENDELIVIRQITSCDWIPKFSKLTWDRDNDARQPESQERGHDDKEVLNRQPKRQPQIPPETKGFDEVDGTAAESFGADRNAVEQHLFTEDLQDVFVQFNSVAAAKLPQEETRYRTGEIASQRARQAQFDSKMSTLTGRFGAEIGGPVVLETNRNPRALDVVAEGASGREPPVSLLVFAAKLAQGNDVPGYSVEFVDVWPTTHHANGVRIFSLPARIGTRQPAWLFQNVAKTKPRLAIAAKVTRYADDGEQVRIVIDLEEQIRLVPDKKPPVEIRRNFVYIFAQRADPESVEDALAEILRARAFNDGYLHEVCASNHYQLGLRQHVALDSKRHTPIGLMEWVFSTKCDGSTEVEAEEVATAETAESALSVEPGKSHISHG